MPKLDREGVHLFYQEAGSGDPPCLFVHGWSCDNTYFAPQMEHFGRTQRVVSFDLRGHGQSDSPDQAYTIEALASDLAWLSGQLGLTKPVVVGHSMGGIVALCLAARYPDLPAAIVCLDAPIAQPPAWQDAVRPIVEKLRAPDYQETVRSIVAGMFLPTDDAERKAKIIEGMASTPQHVMASFMEEGIDHDSAATAAACRVPVLNVWSAGGFPDLTRFREACPRLVHGQTIGSGHFHQLEVPEQINAMIERFLAISLPRAAATPS